jgi:hypothetical protein
VVEILPISGIKQIQSALEPKKPENFKNIKDIPAKSSGESVEISDRARTQNLIQTIQELVTGVTSNLIQSLNNNPSQAGIGSALNGVLQSFQDQTLTNFLFQHGQGLTPEAQQEFGFLLSNLQNETISGVLDQLRPQIQSNLLDATEVNSLLNTLFDRIHRTLGFD